MRTRLLFLAGLFIISIAACNKHHDTQNNSTNTVKLLRQFKMVAGADTINKYDYAYDSQNRIATSHVLNYETTTLSREATLTFNYNGSDTFPSNVRMDFTDHIAPYSSVTYEYFIYDGSGKLVKDSIFENPGSLVYYFAYYPDHIELTTSFQDTVISQLTTTNGNIVSEMDTVYGPFLATGFHVNLSAGYDNHPNPHYNVGIKRVMYNMPENYFDDDFVPAVKNNFLEAIKDDNGTPPHNAHVQYSYTYDTDGYPLTVTEHDVLSGISFTGYYYY